MTFDVRRDKAIWALLIEKFGLRPWEIAKLTDRQIQELYFHPRDKQGCVIFPTEKLPQVQQKLPDTLEGELAALASLQGMMKKSDYEGAVRELRAKYERANSTHKPNSGSEVDG